MFQGNPSERVMDDISSINLLSGADSSVINMRSLLQTVTPFALEQRVILVQDEHTVVKFGTLCSFRGRQVNFCQKQSVFGALVTA